MPPKKLKQRKLDEIESPSPLKHALRSIANRKTTCRLRSPEPVEKQSKPKVRRPRPKKPPVPKKVPRSPSPPSAPIVRGPTEFDNDWINLGNGKRIRYYEPPENQQLPATDTAINNPATQITATESLQPPNQPPKTAPNPPPNAPTTQPPIQPPNQPPSQPPLQPQKQPPKPSNQSSQNTPTPPALDQQPPLTRERSPTPPPINQPTTTEKSSAVPEKTTTPPSVQAVVHQPPAPTQSSVKSPGKRSKTFFGTNPTRKHRTNRRKADPSTITGPIVDYTVEPFEPTVTDPPPHRNAPTDLVDRPQPSSTEDTGLNEQMVNESPQFDGPVPQSDDPNGDPINPTNIESQDSNQEPLLSIRCKSNPTGLDDPKIKKKRGVNNGKEVADAVHKNGGKRIMVEKHPTLDIPKIKKIKSLLVHDIGSCVRDKIPMTVPKFGDLNEAALSKLFTHISASFDIGIKDQSNWLWNYILGKAVDRFKGWKHECKTHWEKYDGKLPREFVNRRDEWDWLCRHFENPDQQAKCTQMADVRTKGKRITHRGGKRSFADIADELEEQGEAAPHIAAFEKVYSADPMGSEAAEQMKKMVEEIRLSQGNSEATSYEEGEPSSLSVAQEVEIMQKVLGKKKGVFVSGMGAAVKKATVKRGRPKSSDETKKLKDELAEAKARVADQEAKMAEQERRLKEIQEANEQRFRALEIEVLKASAAARGEKHVEDNNAPPN